MFKEMLSLEFMRLTLIAGFMLSLMIPMIGVVMVNRKTSMVGDALSHTSLAGVGFGLILGINPVWGALAICIVSGFAIEIIRRRFPQYGDMATAVTMSSGLGLAAILSDFAPGGNTFESYLFGTITAISKKDVISVSIVFVLVLLASILRYASLLDIALDPNMARLAGVKVRVIEGIFTFLSAVSIALACKVIGALLVASLIVLPVAAALMISRSYKQTYITSLILGCLYSMLGLVLSYEFDLRPGGIITMNAVAGMLILAAYAKIRKIHTKSTVEI